MNARRFLTALVPLVLLATQPTHSDNQGPKVEITMGILVTDTSCAAASYALVDVCDFMNGGRTPQIYIAFPGGEERGPLRAAQCEAARHDRIHDLRRAADARHERRRQHPAAALSGNLQAGRPAALPVTERRREWPREGASAVEFGPLDPWASTEETP
jgi:hypothetical protein